MKFGDVAVDPLLSLIDKSNFLTQSHAIDLLGKIGGERAFEGLRAKLNTRKAKANSEAEKAEIFVRSSAAAALGNLGDPRALEDLRAAASEDVFIIRLKALGSLVLLGEKDALDGVLEGLGYGDPTIRGIVINELGRLKQTRSLINLERFVRTVSKSGIENTSLSKETQKNVDEAVRSIEKILSDVSGVPPGEVQKDDLDESTFETRPNEETSKDTDFRGYAALVNHLDEEIRLDAVKALAEISSPPIELLRTALSDKSENVRRETATCLGATKRLEVQPLLIDCLEHDSDNSVRMVAAEALGDLGDNGVRELLMKALDDPYVLVKMGAAPVWLNSAIKICCR